MWESWSNEATQKLGRANVLQVPKIYVELVYCRYPKVRESWSNEATQKLGRANVLQVPKIYGELVYCRYPKVRESWSTADTQKFWNRWCYGKYLDFWKSLVYFTHSK